MSELRLCKRMISFNSAKVHPSAVLCLVAQSCLTLCNPMDCRPPGFSRQEYWSGLPCLPGDLSNPRIKPRSFTLQMDSLPSGPPGKPKNTGVSSLCLLQGIFATQELNRGLLHCRQILYQLSYQGIPSSAVASCYLQVMR